MHAVPCGKVRDGGWWRCGRNGLHVSTGLRMSDVRFVEQRYVHGYLDLGTDVSAASRGTGWGDAPM